MDGLMMQVPLTLVHLFDRAGDSVVILDDVLWPLWERLRPEVKPRHVIVWGHGQPVPEGAIDYEQLIEPELPDFSPPLIGENDAAGLCYTSGTTGHPKGVLYSHRALVVHSLISAVPASFGLSKSDVVLPVVPMFHVNAWGLPFTATMVGAKQVFPGPHLDPVSVLNLLADEQVTLTAGVPTVWLAILDQLDCNPGKWNLKTLHTMIVGGSAAPQSMIEGFEKRYGPRIVHAWGMTEMSPIGTLCKPGPRGARLPDPERFRLRAMQGTAVPFVDVRAVGDQGEVPWDGKSMGELHVRGPCVARSYFRNPAEADKFTMDGWFRTGDVVTIDPEGYLRITDRSKDLIKSGGEWISSVDVENALMGHPAVKEAAVGAGPHERWSGRPVACGVFKEGAKASDEERRALLEPPFAEVLAPGAFGCPLPEGARDGGGVHVRSGRDAAGAPFLQVGEEELLAADEHLEAGKGAKHRARILEVAGAVLHPDDNARISLHQPSDHAERDRDLRHLRDVVQVHAKLRLCRAVDGLREAAEEPLLGHVLVIERRQHQHAGATRARCFAREADGIGERAASRARDQLLRREAGVEQRVEQPFALVEGERIPLAGGAEGGEAVAAFIQKRPAEANESCGVRGQVPIERRGHRREGALHGRHSTPTGSSCGSGRSTSPLPAARPARCPGSPPPAPARSGSPRIRAAARGWR